MSQLKQLKEKRATAHAAAISELGKAVQTVESRAAADAALAEVETISQDIARVERADKLAAEVRGTDTVPVDPAAAQVSAEEQAKIYRKSFVEHLTRGDGRNPRTSVKGGATERAMSLLNGTKLDMQRAENDEKRDQIAGTQSITYSQGPLGGYFVPTGFVFDIDKATKYFAPLLDGSTVRIMETATGAVLPYPTSNDTNNAWMLIGETVQVTDQGAVPNYPTQGSAPTGQPGNVLAGHVNFNAYKGSTGAIRVSLELMQDSAFNIESFLTEAFAQRLGRGYEYYLTNGSGSNAPTGILPAIAASGAVPVVAAGSSFNDGSASTGANSIGYADLVNLIHSVDPTYRYGAKFMLADSSVRFLRTLLDKFGRPLWVPGVKDNEPDTICGYQYVINQSFPAIAASATTVAFGQWSKFIVRKVRDLQVVRLDERFADQGEVGFVAFSRIDCNLVDAGTHPLNVLQQHS